MSANAKYYNDTSDSTARNLQTDEMMISNMLRALENPILSKLMTQDELAVLCSVIKNHVVARATMISEEQNKDMVSSHIRNIL